MSESPIVHFLMGGTIVAGGSYLANSVNPFWAALFATFPVELVILFTIKSQEKRRMYSKSLMLVSMSLVIAAGFFYKLEPTNVLSHNQEIILSLVVWIVLALLANAFFSPSK